MYNRSQVDNMCIDITYQIRARKIKFSFFVCGFNLADDYSDGTNIYLEYYYNCCLRSIEDSGEWINTCFNKTTGLPQCDNYFTQMLQVKDLTFLTDLLFEYLFLGNPRNMKCEQFNDKEYLNKLRESYRKIDKLQDDFK